MSITENELLRQTERDLLVQRAACELQRLHGTGGVQELRARRAYIMIGAMMVNDQAKVDEPFFQQYLIEQYTIGTNGETLPIAFPSSPAEWRTYIRHTFRAFEPIKAKWKPDNVEFAEAILRHDDRVSFNP